MKIKRQIEKDGLIVTHFGGLHTYNDAVEAFDELVELNKGSKSIFEIAVNDDDIKMDFSREEEESLVSKINATFSKFDMGALAIVASSDLVFGLSRVIEMSIQNERIAISVFRSEALARKWIQEIKELHNQQLHENRS